MNKILKFFLIFIGVIVATWVVGRFTNTFQYYTEPTNANEPTIKMNGSLLASRFISPKRLDFIWFNGETPFGRQLRLLRLCGLPNDLIEIKNGELLINNIDTDLKLKLAHNYSITRQELESIKDVTTISEDLIKTISGDTLSVPLSDELVNENKINARRIISPPSFEDPEIYQVFKKKWNQDIFGPVKVPEGKYFVLGDNRHNAYDSRYVGFIDQKDYVATVFWKK